MKAKGKEIMKIILVQNDKKQLKTAEKIIRKE
jgi:hypothetical protein